MKNQLLTEEVIEVHGNHFPIAPVSVEQQALQALDEEAFQVDEEAFQIATAPVLSEILEGLRHEKVQMTQGAKEHPKTDQKARLSAEARALAEYLLKGLNFRLESMDFRLAAISTAISGLEESFRNHDVDMKARFSGPHKDLANNLQATPHLDSQFAAFAALQNSFCGKVQASEQIAGEMAGAEQRDTQMTQMTQLTRVGAAENDEVANKSSSPNNPGGGSLQVKRLGPGISIAARMTRQATAGMFGQHEPEKKTLDQEEYNVTQLYHDSGWAQMIAKSDIFANLTLIAIFTNAVYIGYDADNNFEDNLLDADAQFIFMENLFCVFFTLEWIIRFCSFRFKIDCLKDGWFKFDTLLVLMMVADTWVFPVVLSGGTGIPSGLVKMIRLLRICRMTRLMRASPELVSMIKGVKVASRAVGSALLMLVGLIYVFAIIMFTLLKREDDPLISMRFRKLGITMWTLLIDGTFLDSIGVLSRALMDANRYFATCLLLLFVLLSALTVMNMLIGVLCEVVSAVATAEKEEIAIRMVKDNLLTCLKELDEDGSGELSREEILEVLKHDEAMEVLESLQVDVKHLMEHLDMFFESEGSLAIHKVLDTILMMRGDRPPMMKDYLHGEDFNRWKLVKSFNRRMDALETAVRTIETAVRIPVSMFQATGFQSTGLQSTGNKKMSTMSHGLTER